MTSTTNLKSVALAISLAALATPVSAAVLIISGTGTESPFDAPSAATYFSSIGPITTNTITNVMKADITAADSFAPGQTVISYLNSFDLVVLGSGFGAGTAYDRAGWAQVTSGVLSISAFQTRNDRFGWTTLSNLNFPADAANETTIVDGTHEITAGFSGAVNVFNAYAASVPQAYAAGALGGAGGDILATGPSGAVSIAVWETGDTIQGNAGSLVVAGRRGFFAINQNAWLDSYFDTDGRTLFQNTANWVASVPEPSTYAAILAAVLMLGCLWKRNRK